MNDPGNDFRTVAITSANTATLIDANSIELGAIDVTNLDVTAHNAGDITQIADNPVITTDGLSVSGTATFNVDSGRSITLAHPDNNIGIIVFNPVGGITFQDISITNNLHLTLSDLDLTGDLEVTALGGLTSTGVLAIDGVTTLDVGTANDITLLNAANDFNEFVVLAAKDVDVQDVNDIVLGGGSGGITVAGDLDVIAGGNITDEAAISVATGLTTLSSTGDITLDHTDNDFRTVAIASANTATLIDANSIELGAIDVTNLNVTANNNGDITQIADNPAITTDGLNVSGTATFAMNSGRSITLAHPDNNIASLVFTPIGGTTFQDITLANNAHLTLSDLDLTGNLLVTALGGLTSNGVLAIDGVTTLDVGAANDINLLNPDNDFSEFVVLAANTVNVQDVNAITLGGSLDGINFEGITIDGDLSITAGGNITDAAAINVATGLTTLSSTGDITLDHTDNDFRTVAIASANTATLIDANSIELGAIDVTNLNVTANNNGDITQIADNPAITTDGLNVSGTATFAMNSGRSITLAHPDNNIASLVFTPIGGTTFQDITLANNAHLTLSDLDLTGNLLVTALGGLTSNGVLAIDGVTTLDVGAANDINLLNPDNDFSEFVVLAANTVNVQDVNAITLGGSLDGINFEGITIDGDLSITAGGNITDVAGILVTNGTTTLDTTGDITLDHAANDFNQLIIHNANHAEIHDDTAITLDGITVAGNLGITAGGNITDTATISADNGITTLTAINDIILDEPENDFATLSILNGRHVTVMDRDDIVFGESAIRGELEVTAVGITQSGAIIQTGMDSVVLNAGEGAIVLGATNTFTGPVSLHNSGAFDVTLVNSGDLTLSDSTLGTGALSIEADSIAQTDSAITQAESAGAVSLNAMVGNIELTQNNEFTGSVSVNTPGNAILNDISDIQLGASEVGVDLTVTAGVANDITQVDEQNDDADGLTVNGKATFVVDSERSIELNNPANKINELAFVTRDGGDRFENIGIANSIPLILGEFKLNGDLTVTATGGLTSTEPLDVLGVTTLNVGEGNDINLSSDQNDFNTLVILAANNVEVHDRDDIVLGNAGNDFSVLGNLTVNTQGSIEDGSNLFVGNLATFDAGTADVILDSVNNQFTTVNIAAANNVTLVDQDALALGASNIGGDLSVTANGLISDAGGIEVAGLTTLTAGLANNIVFDHADNDFATVNIVSALDASLRDSNDIRLGASRVQNDLTVTAGADSDISQVGDDDGLFVGGTAEFQVTAGRSIELNNDNNQIKIVVFTPLGGDRFDNIAISNNSLLTLGELTLDGNLTVNAPGGLISNDVLTVAGVTTLDVGALNSITLDNPTNEFNQLVVVDALDVTIADITGITLGDGTNGVTAFGDLSVVAGGNIEDAGAIVVANGVTQLLANGHDVVLNAPGNDFLTVSVTAANATLEDSNSIQLGASTVTNALNVTAGPDGDIFQTDTPDGLTVGGLATLTVDSGRSIELNNPANRINALAFVPRDGDGNFENISIANAVLLSLDDLNLTGDLTVNAAGGLNSLGVLNVAGVTRLDVGDGNDINLGNVNHGLNALVVAAAQNVTVRDANDITLGHAGEGMIVSGNLTVTAGRDINNEGNIDARNGTTVLDSGTGSITLTSSGNDFNVVSILDGHNVTLNDVNDIDLADVTVANDLSVTAGGHISDSGTLVANSGIATFSGTGDITLDSVANNFDTVSIENGRHVTLVDINSIAFGPSTINGALNVTSLGIDQSGAIVQTDIAPVTFNAGSGAIHLTGENNFIGAVTLLNNGAADVAITDIDHLELASSSVGQGALTVTTAAGISQTGKIVQAANGGAVTFDGGDGDIQLTQVNEFSGPVSINTLQNAWLTEADAVQLGASAVLGNLNVTAGLEGDITQLMTDSGVQVNGLATFTVDGGQSVDLSNSANRFNTVHFDTNVDTGSRLADVSLFNAQDLQLGGLLLTGDLTVDAIGNLNGSETMNVPGVTMLTAEGGNINFSNAANDFLTLVVIAANDATFRDVGGLTLGNGLQGVEVDGDLSVTSTDAITDNGTVDVANGIAFFSTGINNNIILDHDDNNFRIVQIGAANDVVLSDRNGIDLGNISANGAFSVTANGFINNSGSLNIVGAAQFTGGENNDIMLTDPDNRIEGPIGFAALNGDLLNISLTNNTATQLQGLTVSQNLDITAVGNISDIDAIKVGENATFNAAGFDIVLDNIANEFDNVSVTSARDILLHDAATVNLLDIASSGFVEINALDDINQQASAAINATTGMMLSSGDALNQNGILNSTGGEIALVADGGLVMAESAATVNTAGAVSYTSTSGIVEARDITAFTDIDIRSETSEVRLNGALASSTGDIAIASDSALTMFDSGAITASGGSIEMISENAGISSQTLSARQNIVIQAHNGALAQNATFAADQGNVDVQVGGAIVMATDARTSVDNGNIRYEAGDNVHIAQLSGSSRSTVSATSNGGAIIDVNGDSANVIAGRVELTATSGIGSDNAFETETAALSVANISGVVNLSNSGDVTIDQLLNNGDITFRNDFDITIDRIDANRDTGTLFMVTTAGSFLGEGPTPTFDDPDITAQTATFFGVLGTFGQVNRPLVLDVPGSVVVRARGSFSPLFVPPGPASFEDSSLLQFNFFETLAAISGESTQEVETLAQVDPAVFMEVLNYYIDETPLKMPLDQVYDVEGDAGDEEEDDTRAQDVEE